MAEMSEGTIPTDPQQLFSNAKLKSIVPARENDESVEIGETEAIAEQQESSVTGEIVGRGVSASDVLYYRTKWPWPLKDRDYSLARRYDRRHCLLQKAISYHR